MKTRRGIAHVSFLILTLLVLLLIALALLAALLPQGPSKTPTTTTPTITTNGSVPSGYAGPAWRPKGAIWEFDAVPKVNLTAVRNDLVTIKKLGFDAIVAYDESFVNGANDGNFQGYQMTGILKIAEQEQIKVLIVACEAQDLSQFWQTSWDPGTTFRSWMGTHLQSASQAWKNYSKVIAGLVWDDIPNNQITNYTEFSQFAFSNFDIGRPYLQVYDSALSIFGRINIDGHSQLANNTESLVYQYASYQGPSWTGTDWIIQADPQGHTNFGVILDTYDGGWTVPMISQQFHFSRSVGAQIEFYAWRQGSPETTSTLYWRPDSWSSITLLNSQ